MKPETKQTLKYVLYAAGSLEAVRGIVGIKAFLYIADQTYDLGSKVQKSMTTLATGKAPIGKKDISKLESDLLVFYSLADPFDSTRITNVRNELNAMNLGNQTYVRNTLNSTAQKVAYIKGTAETLYTSIAVCNLIEELVLVPILGYFAFKKIRNYFSKNKSSQQPSSS